jgi:hypothetical protein
MVVSDDLSFAVDEEFLKVPGNGSDSFSLSICELAVGSEELVEWVSGGSVDVNLGEELVISLVIGGGEVLDVDFTSWFLGTELVAWESEDFKSLFELGFNFGFQNWVFLIDIGSLCRFILLMQ